MKKNQFVLPRIDQGLVKKAVSALIKHHDETVSKEDGKQATLHLLGSDRPVHVQFGLEMAPVEPSRKATRILIPNPLHQLSSKKDSAEDGIEEVDVCLIVKEESKPWVQEMISEFKDHLGCVKKVLGLDSLRKKHARYTQRRELLHKYDVFMADDRIIPMLTAALGKDFVKAKKLPIPIRLTRKEALPFAVQKNLSATYLTLSQGTSITVRAGNTGMPLKKLVENVVAIAEEAAGKVPRKWANIRNISVKTPESTALPFYNKLPEELLEISRMAGITPAFKSKDLNKIDEIKEDRISGKKRESAAKSPLVQALKKVKKEETRGASKHSPNDNEIAATSADKQKLNKKRDKKKQNTEKFDTNEGRASASVADQKDGNKKTKLGKAEKGPNSSSKIEELKNEAIVGKNAKLGFVASKKFSGSKNGFVFRNGDKGVGYYVDVKPVVDKMVLAAIFRSSQGNGSSKRRKTGEKKRGRR